MNQTKIDWCTRTLNPVVGCTYGCPFCYAHRMNNRFHYIPDFSKPQFFPERLKQLAEKKPQIIFMDSMSDIADWEDEWAYRTADAIHDNPQHKYIFLTKRPEIGTLLVGNNLWNGVTVTRQNELIRIPQLFEFIDNRAFVSIEPILGPIDLRVLIQKPQWVIIGAETGNRKDKVIPKREWIESIVSECRVAGIPIFMKGSLIKVWNAPLIQEFPWEAN